ncbi:hypothetical protein IG631_00228 [Alternaria alternata]|nr:hypothetical protein IG631_00228 [Alternaria alternata]
MSSTTTNRINQVDEGIELAELFGGSTPSQRVNTDTTSPTPVLPPADHIRSSTSDHDLSSIREVSLDTRKLAVVLDEKKTWFGYVVEYAPNESLALLLDVAVK